MKNRLILIAIALASVFIVYGLSQTSRLEITTTGGSQTNYSYAVMKQSNDKSSSTKSDSNVFSKTLATGSYEVKVTQGSLSSYAVVKTAGFFRTTKITADLKPELARSFVGDNPAVCMSLLGTTLLSNDCGGLSSDIYTHIPSTPTQPTYVDTALSPYGHFEGNARTKAGTLALFASQPPVPDNVDAAPPILHTVYTYDPTGATFQPKEKAVLDGLSSGESYSLQAYRDGFIAYDKQFTQVFYYASIHAKPVNITLEQPKTSGLNALSLSSNEKGELAVAYASAIEDEEASKNRNKSTNTEIIVSENDKSTHLTFNARYSTISYCGANLCMLNSDKHILEINTISGTSTNQIFAIHNVSKAATDDHGILALRQDGLLRIDPESKVGYIEYSLGRYQSCGLQASVNGPLLCLINPEGNNVVLHISQQANNTDSIDKKVLVLESYGDVNTLSIVGNVIYIVPKGVNIMDYVNKTNAPDPTVQGKINAGIMNAADKAGIDRNTYVINITQPL